MHFELLKKNYINTKEQQIVIKCLNLHLSEELELAKLLSLQNEILTKGKFSQMVKLNNRKIK